VDQAALLPHSDRRYRPLYGATSRDEQDKTLYDIRYSQSRSYCNVDDWVRRIQAKEKPQYKNGIILYY
jgi:hypothetical protein